MMDKFQTERVSEQLSVLAARDDLNPEVQTELADLASEFATPLQSDKWIYRLVVCFLGSTVLVTVLGSITIVLVHYNADINIPDGVIALGSAAVGALAGLLAPSPDR
ncbi:MAG: hypothetical protein ACE37E_08980 [Hyphomicrobiales bacterium]